MPTESGGDQLLERRLLERSGLDQRIEGQGQRHGRAGDGRGARAAVGLDHVAVEDHGALAQGLHVHDRAQAAADQALNLVGAAADLAALALPRACG